MPGGAAAPLRVTSRRGGFARRSWRSTGRGHGCDCDGGGSRGELYTDELGATEAIKPPGGADIPLDAPPNFVEDAT